MFTDQRSNVKWSDAFDAPIYRFPTSVLHGVIFCGTVEIAAAAVEIAAAEIAAAAVEIAAAAVAIAAAAVEIAAVAVE